MKHIAIALVLLVGAASAQSKPRTPSTGHVDPAVPPANREEGGRYQLIAVKAPAHSTSGSIEAFDELFLYDTATGRVSRYDPSVYLGEKGDPDRTSTDPYFSEVTVDGLHGSHMDEMKKVAEFYNYLHEARVRAYCKDHLDGWYRGPTAPATDPGTYCGTFLKEHPSQ